MKIVYSGKNEKLCRAVYEVNKVLEDRDFYHVIKERLVSNFLNER